MATAPRFRQMALSAIQSSRNQQMPDSHPTNDELGDEYELEPVDPDILAHQRQQGELRTDRAQAAVDEELIRRSEDPGDPLTWEELKSFRFTRRHLLIITGLLAMILAMCQLAGTGKGIFITATLAVSAGWLFTMRRERIHEARVERMRHDMEARREAQKQAGDTVSNQPVAAPSTEECKRIDEMEPRPAIKISFSMKEMLLAVTGAAILLALVRCFGPGPLAILLGMIALGGLVAQAVGLEAPPIAIFFWWILLVLYLLLGILHSAAPKGDVACRPVSPTIRVTMIS